MKWSHMAQAGWRGPGTGSSDQAEVKTQILSAGLCVCVFHSSEWGQISFSKYMLPGRRRSGLGEKKIW